MSKVNEENTVSHIVIGFLFLLALATELAATAGAAEYRDATNGNWNAPGTWKANSGFPGKGDTAVIAGHTVGLTNSLVSGTNAPASIVLNGTGVLQSQQPSTTLKVDSPIILNGGTIRGYGNGFSLLFTGPMTVAGNGTWDADYISYLTMAGPISGTGTVTALFDAHQYSGVTLASGFNTNWTGTLNVTGTVAGTFTVRTNQALGSATVNVSGGSLAPMLIFGDPGVGSNMTDVHDYRSIPAPRINVFSNGQVRINNNWCNFNVTLLGVDIALHNGGSLLFGPMGTGRCGGRLYLTNGVGNLYGIRDYRWGTDNYLDSEIIGTGRLVINADATAGRNFHLTGNNTNFSGGVTLRYNNLNVEHPNALGSGECWFNAGGAGERVVLTNNAHWVLRNNLGGTNTIQVENGSGNYRLTNLGAVIQPGASNGAPGVLTIDGAFAFGRTPFQRAMLRVDVVNAGSFAGVNYDQLKVLHGDAALAASITNAVLALNLSVPESRLKGRIAVVLRAPGADFSAYRFSDVTGAGRTAQVIYDAGEVAVAWGASGVFIRNTGCSDVIGTSARVHGMLLSTGDAPTQVRCYWGTNDMGEGAWANTNDLGIQAVGQVTATLTKLANGQKYYYRFRATSAEGDIWASGSRSFITTFETVLGKVAGYAEAEDLDRTRGLFESVAGGKAPTPEAVSGMAGTFRALRLYEEGVEALRLLAPFCTNDTLLAVRREEGRMLIRSGRIREGLAVLKGTGALPNVFADEAAYAGVLEKQSESIIVEEAVALVDTIDSVSRQASMGAEALNLLKRQGMQIQLRGDGIGIDAVEFIRQEASKWPRAAVFQEALGREAERALASLPEDDLRKFGEYWRLYGGTPAANAGAQRVADRLLDAGHPDLAFLWYGALRRTTRSPTLDAKWAYAQSLAPASGPPTDLLAALSAAERSASVRIGDRTVTVEQFVRGLTGKPRQPPSPFPGGAGLSACWKAPVFPSDELMVNVSTHITYRDSFLRPVCRPEAAGRTVLVNNGLSLRRYDADSGSNLWTVAFDPVVVGDMHDATSAIATPKIPPPLFGVAVEDNVAVCRHAERMTSFGLAITFGLTALDVETGAPRWRSRDIDELAEMHIASEPCLASGIVYFLARGSLGGSTGFRALAVEARTGTVLWNRLLVMGDDLRGTHYAYAEVYGCELPRALATPRGICFSTHMGRLFLLDPLTGGLVWMRSYTRAPGDDRAPRSVMNPLLLRGDAVIAAPYDSARIFALNLATGESLWDVPASVDSLLAGVWKGLVVTFGERVRLLDSRTGATAAVLPLDWKPVLPFGVVNGDRLWVSEAGGARLFDLATLKPAANFPTGERLLPAGGLAVSCAPNLISAFRATDAAAPLGPPARTVRSRAVPSAGPKRDAPEPPDNAEPRRLWSVDSPASFSLPDEDRGLALVHGYFNARLIDTEGFGEPYWEYRSSNIIRRVFWTDETVLLGTDTELIGMDLSTGVERWRLPAKKDFPAMLAVKGDLLIPGLTNNTEVLCVNPKDGAVRWRCEMPSNQVVSAVRKIGERLYLERRSAGVPSASWVVQELGADGKLGRELCANPEFSKNKIGFWDLGEDRVFTAGEGAVYRCWNLAMKTMLWKEPFTIPGSWVTDKYALTPTPDGRPWWFLSGYQGKNAVLDPLTGEVLYRGGGWSWNGTVMEFVWAGTHVLSRMRIAPGKPAEKAWTTNLGQYFLSLHPAGSGAVVRMVAYSRPQGDVNVAPAWFMRIDPATGAVQKTSLMLPPMVPANQTVVWKYANRRIFLASPQSLHGVAVMAPDGGADWYAERRGLALRIGDPSRRARVLRGVNESEQLHRVAEASWDAAQPLAIDRPWNWIPAPDGGVRARDWRGPADVSGVVTAEVTAAATLRIVVDVRDDTWVPMNADGGDAVLVGGEIAIGLDSRFRTVVAIPDAARGMAPVAAMVAATGPSRLRYTVELPAAWRNPYASNASNTVFNLSLGIRDDDGDGVKGAMEWSRCRGTGTVTFRK